jgi:hypothetical protein
MFDSDGVRILNDAEMQSASADRLQDIQRRLAKISRRLGWIAGALWTLVAIAVLHLGAR